MRVESLFYKRYNRAIWKIDFLIENPVSEQLKLLEYFYFEVR